MNSNKESYLKLKATVRNRLVSAFEKAQLVMTRPKLKDDKSCKSLKQKTLSWKATKTKKFPPEDSNDTISDISISDDEDLNELVVDIKTPNLSNQMDLKKSENATTFKMNQTLKRSCLSPENHETSAKIPRTINKTKNYSNITSENMRNYLLPKLSHCTDGEISKQSGASICLKSNSQNDIGLNKAKNRKVDESDSRISLTEYIALSDDESCMISSNCRSSINDQSTETESPLPNSSDIIFKSPSSKFNIKEGWVPGRKYVIRSLHAYDIEGLWDGTSFNVTGCHGKNGSTFGSCDESEEVEKISISSDGTVVGDSKATLGSRKCISSLLTQSLRSQEDAHSKTTASQISENPESTLSSSPGSHRKDGKLAPNGDSPLKSDTCLDLSDSATDAQKVLSQDDSDIRLPTTQKNVRRSTPRKRFLDLVQLSSDEEGGNKGSSTTTETDSLKTGSVGSPPETANDLSTSANCVKLSEVVFQSRSCSCDSCFIVPGGIRIQLNKNKTTKSLDLYIRSDEIISIGCCTGVTSQTEIHMTVSNKCSGRLREFFDVKPSKTNNQSYGQLILQVSEMERLEQVQSMMMNMDRKSSSVQSDKTSSVLSDEEKKTSPVKSDKEKQTLPVKSDKEKKSLLDKSDKERKSLPVKSDKEKQTLPVKSDKERKSLPVKLDKERKSLPVKLDQEKITSFVILVGEKKKSSEKSSVELDEEKNTSSVKSDREKKTSSIKSDVEKKISTVQSDKEKKTNSQNEASDTRNDRYRTRSSQTKLSRSGSTPAIVKLFDYPPSQSVGRISVTNEDLRCLNAHEFLNDVIIDFYLKYLHSELLSPADRSRTHIFSSFFFGRMMAKPNRTECNDDNLSLAQKRHALVQTWTRHVDLFSKDFIIIPINESSHWFLAIICFPWLCDVGNSETEQTNACSNACSSEDDLFMDPPTKIPSKEADDGNSSDLVKHPCILIFDSLGGSGRWNAPSILRDYLQTEWDRKKSTTEGTRTFDKLTMKSCRPRCPQQTNFSDCGIYLLQYAESFFKNPLKNFTPPIISLKQWFPSHETKNKRHAIQTLILQLAQKLNPSLDYEPEADGCHLVNVKENN